MKKLLLSVVGPTAIGKTALAIALATHFKTEILSADSRQFFKEMSIGTAVPSAAELNAVVHHFIHHRTIFEGYSVGDYERDAIKLLAKLHHKNNIVVLVGGSGLYIDAVTQGLDQFPQIDSKIRESLNLEYRTKGIHFLQNELKKRDAAYYKMVDLENPHRLIRALEVCIGSKQPYSFFLKKDAKPRPFDLLTIGISADREIIYDRINRRVDAMFANGLVKEARSLYEHRGLNALQTVGYKELFTHFDGDWELDFAIEEIKKNTRRFAKRQMTWFKKNPSTIWIAHDNPINDTITIVENNLVNLNK